MDNTVIPYQDTSDSSEDNNSSDDEYSQLLSNNIGVLYNKYQKNEKFMNMESSKEYEQHRNQLFTPQILKKYFTVKLNASSTSFSLKDTIKLPTDNIIGFKMIKSNFVGDNTNHFTDLSIPEIPEIACDKNEAGDNIVARIPLRKLTSDFYTHQYLELSLINRYFYPISLDNLTFQLSVVVSGFIVIEISYLNNNIKS